MECWGRRRWHPSEAVINARRCEQTRVVRHLVEHNLLVTGAFRTGKRLECDPKS